jgi:Ca-activated chloride channel homolog
MTTFFAARLAVFCAATLLIGESRSTEPGDRTDRSALVTFTGTVLDAGNSPIAGAQVLIAPWRQGGITNARGVYTIAVPAARPGNQATITVTHIGYASVSRQITIGTEAMRMDFRLNAAAVSLEELRVQGKASPAIRARSTSTVSNVMAGYAAPPIGSAAWRRGDPRDYNTESYAAIEENPFRAVSTNPLSTFSIDVDRASYANVRRFIREGRMPPKDAVRIEELVNYFSYDDPAPANRTPFAVRTELASAPWRPAHKLLRIGLKAKDIAPGAAPANNLVFLIDVSGSMQPVNKLPLLKQAFGLLVNELRPIDRVALVVYAGNAGLVLESTPGNRKETILAAIERLEAGGSTAGGAGLRLAYDVALRHHIKGGNNRVILATDGDFNVGESSDAAMLRLVEEKRGQGTFLTVLGFGEGNLKDSKMETLANKGNGNYSYIDDIAEARKVLVHELGGTLLTVAKDVKLQVEFNPRVVRAYRLIGYENRMLAAEDFKDDTKDAGELGAGHSVTALYEIVPVGVKTDLAIRTPDSLRYQTPAVPAQASGSDELGFVRLRYKAPDGERSTEIAHAVPNRDTEVSADFTFSAAVAAFGMVLRESPHRGSATLQSVAALARDGRGDDAGGYRAGFIELVDATIALSKRVAGR